MEIIKTLINLDVGVYVYAGLFLFLVVGILYKDKPKSIKDYALGSKAFSTPVLVATMVATFIGAGNTIGYGHPQVNRECGALQP
jgi:Na+/proline symporter